MDKLDIFIATLEIELRDRHNVCEDFAATPCGILLSVLNAVAAAKEKVNVSGEESETKINNP